MPVTPAATALAAAAALGATLLYGISASYTKRNLTGVDSLVVATGTMTAATVVLLPFAVFWWPATPISSQSWGAVIALGIGQYVASMLFQVSPRDPVAFGIATATLLAVSAAACLIPARRATRVNPIDALRFD